MKVVLTPELCEISGYFKTLSEDPECKEVEIPDEYSSFIDDILLFLDDKSNYRSIMSVNLPDFSEEYLDRYVKMCHYFGCNEILHKFYMIRYEYGVRENSVYNAYTTVLDIIKVYNILDDNEIIHIIDEAKLLELNVFCILSLPSTPLCVWDSIFDRHIPYKLKPILFAVCPYSDLLMGRDVGYDEDIIETILYNLYHLNKNISYSDYDIIVENLPKIDYFSSLKQNWLRYNERRKNTRVFVKPVLEPYDKYGRMNLKLEDVK